MNARLHTKLIVSQPHSSAGERSNFLAHGNGWNCTEIGSLYDRKIPETSQGDVQSEFNHGFYDVREYAAKQIKQIHKIKKRTHVFTESDYSDFIPPIK